MHSLNKMTDCVANLTEQPLEVGSPDCDIKKPLFGAKSLWLHFADVLEIRRLAKLHLRIVRKERALEDLHSECSKIKIRCIDRMNRLSGKS